MIWYPEIAGALSPHVLAVLFFDCLPDGHVIPGEPEHATSIGMAVESVLGTHLIMEPEDKGLREVCNRLYSEIRWAPSSKETFELVTKVLRFLATPLSSTQNRTSEILDLDNRAPGLSTAHKLWSSRVIIHAIWLWRNVQAPRVVLEIYPIHMVFEWLMAERDKTPAILRIDCFLVRFRIDLRNLHAPNNLCVVPPFFPVKVLIGRQPRIENSEIPFSPTAASNLINHRGGEISQTRSDFVPIRDNSSRPVPGNGQRRIRLYVDHRNSPFRITPQMETISAKNLNRLLRAVGEPFDATLHHGRTSLSAVQQFDCHGRPDGVSIVGSVAGITLVSLILPPAKWLYPRK